jgi:eukaryotic-like serine/threonine-protein kinase
MLDETAVRAEPWQAGQVIANRYEVLEHLGTGGMGVVYRVMDLSNQRVRAIKTIRKDLDGESKRLVARLLKAEAEALKRLESDFVVRIFEAAIDEEADRPFVVMEYLPGRDLQQWLRTQGPLPIPTTVGMLWQAACALKTIHQHGIVHRDLKPANLYLKTRDDGSLELKVLDFSISRLLDRAGERKTTIVVGTRGFMAPEQAAGYDVDHRADIYSLGQVASALLQATLEAEPAGVEGGAGHALLPAFRAWHDKACAYQREQRFQSATDAIEALARALGVALPHTERTQPISDAHDGLTAAATFAPSTVRPRRLKKRTVGLVIAAGVAIVFLVSKTRNGISAGPTAHTSTASVAVPSSDTGGLLPLPAPSPLPSAAFVVTPVPFASSVAEALSAAPSKPRVAPVPTFASPKSRPRVAPSGPPAQKDQDGTSDRK